MPIYGDAFKTWKGNNNILIETGSFIGDGVQKAIDANFAKVYTFEVIEGNYNICVKRFKDNPNIHCIQGDSVKLMGKVLNEINEPCLFWLDSHFISNGNCDMYPILKELEVIKQHYIKTHTIMIDDVRLFADGKAPEMPMSIREIKEFILTINPDYQFRWEEGYTDSTGINNDILVAYVKTKTETETETKI